MDDLTLRLQSTLDELKQIMKDRQDRIHNLQAEIESIERQNETLETAIQEMLKEF